MSDVIKLAIENIKYDSTGILSPAEHLLVAVNMANGITELMQFGETKDPEKVKIAIKSLDAIVVILLNCAVMTAQKRFERFITPNMN